MKELTLKGIGVSWLPYRMVRRELETGDLISLANKYSQEPLEVAIYADIKEAIALAVLQVWSKAPNIREKQPAKRFDRRAAVPLIRIDPNLHPKTAKKQQGRASAPWANSTSLKNLGLDIFSQAKPALRPSAHAQPRFALSFMI